MAARRGEQSRGSEARTVMVIMPFRETPTRQRAELDHFFRKFIRKPLEDGPAELRFRYRVIRSDDTFDISRQLVSDLNDADVVVCDLSGIDPNPNVMYELGIRLALSDKPVVLIRESHPANRAIFDVEHFYTFDYVPTKPDEVTDHLIDKLTKFERGLQVYRSPVRDLLRGDRKGMSWDEYLFAVDELVRKIDGAGFAADIVLSVGRGGSITGGLLAGRLGGLLHVAVDRIVEWRGKDQNEFHARIVPPLASIASLLANKRVLCVMAECEAGKTLRILVEEAEKVQAAEVRSAAAFKVKKTGYHPTYSGFDVNEIRQFPFRTPRWRRPSVR